MQTTLGTFALGSRDLRFLLTGAAPADVQFQRDNGGTASRPLPIPCNPSLGGIVIDAQ